MTTLTRMSFNDPRAIVERMFSAFGRGDIDAILETVHPESHWTYIGANPRTTKAEFTGHDAVRKFFEGILKRLDISAFNMDEFIVEGNTVVIVGSETGKVRATGEHFHNEWSQKYVVQDKLIVKMVEYNVQVEPRG